MSTDIYAIRRRNLRWLAEQHDGGRFVDVAHRLQRSPNYVSQIAGGYSNIGDQVARLIEQHYNLEQFSLDQPLYETSRFDSASKAIAAADPATQRLVWFLLGGDDLGDVAPVTRSAIRAGADAMRAWLTGTG